LTIVSDPIDNVLDETHWTTGCWLDPDDSETVTI
jgi:hypothetical protein